MIPFPGESVGLAWSEPSGILEDIYYRAGSATISSGTEWRVWIAPGDAWYLDGTSEPVVVSWVVEVLSGSGTLVLAEGLDPTGSNPAASVPTDLGTHVVSGAGTIVATSVRTVAEVISGDYLTLSIDCTAGSVEVQQVKLRVWPPGGPLGGWSTDLYEQPPYNMQPEYYKQGAAPAAGNNVIYTSQGDFRTALATATTSAASQSFPVFTFDGQARMFAWDEPGSLPLQVSGQFHIAYYRTGPGEYLGPGTDGVDYIRPPTEVAFDAGTVLFQTTGPGSVSWFQGVIEARRSADASTGATFYFPAGSFHVSHEVVTDVLPAGVDAYPVIGSGTVIASISSPAESETGTYYDTVSLPEPEVGDLSRLVFWHSGHAGGIAETGGASWLPFRGLTYGETTTVPLRYTWQPDPYRYWVPALTRVIPLRQLHRDDGLGVVPLRAFGGGSRDRTGRAFGYA